MSTVSVVDQLKLATSIVTLPFPGVWYVSQDIASTNIRVTLAGYILLDGSDMLGLQEYLQKSEREWQAYLNSTGFVEAAFDVLVTGIQERFDQASQDKVIKTMSWFIDGEELPGKVYNFTTIEWAPLP